MSKAETADPQSDREEMGAPASPQNLLQPFEDAYKGCFQALAEVQKELCSRQEQDHRAFLEAMQEPQQHVQRVWSEAQQELQRTWQTLAAEQGSEAVSRWEEAWRDAAERVARAQQEAQDQLGRAQSQLAESQKAAWTEACRRGDEALHGYVRALQSAWREVDASTFDLAMLAPIGQSLVTVAGWAAGARTGG